MKDRFRIQKKLYDIIFEADTKAGKIFDIALIILIVFSITIVMLESLPGRSEVFYSSLYFMEWVVTYAFLLEYLVRLWVVRRSLQYALSFFGIIDLLAIIPSFLGLIFTGTHMLVVFRSLRLLRVFRVLKLTRYINEASHLWKALIASRNKISVFLFTVLILVTILGTLMYIVESNEASGFTSIPISIYWAVVTLTTVGYGDIAPVTALGQFLAGLVMILGYAIIAVPTGIVTSELTKVSKDTTTQVCPACLQEGHDRDAEYCKFCGEKLNV
ncbi:ion transporter [Plebeiibacterium sediminum]|uniref:Ion transporter n=1 Tax=Plebeiibacterium sediminum TaxID=2992112 RepID=A0AAE3SEH2_9BACT|nr:ion transporter [Plebeiobacterium sediminum]MCW3785103.1 ion transporter [Plebeiobacterium sediminum]